MNDATLLLYDNPFSPFTRKVRLVLHFKRLPFESVDALALDQLPQLKRLNPRGEVPALVHGERVIVDSADIVAYLDDLQPAPPLLPADLASRARARRWERVAAGSLDAIIHDISLWVWPTHRRQDEPPPGLIEAGHRDLCALLDELEADVTGPFVCGEDPSIADFALFPHVSSLRVLGIPMTGARFPRVLEWQGRMRMLEAVQEDLEHARRAVREKLGEHCPYEREKVVWRGDRIEWLLSRGFDAWWASERASGRAVIP